MTKIEPFEIPYDADMVTDLKRRLHATRWTDTVTSDWSYGTELRTLKHLIQFWSSTYRWRDRVTLLNQLPHFRAEIDGYGLHFLHFRASGEGAVPLLLMNGWPSSFVEYGRLVSLLVEGVTAFDVIIPTLPGFGFSDKATRPLEAEAATLYPELMKALGYNRFMVAGTDIGAGIATRIALAHPDLVLAVHISAVAVKPDSAGSPPASSAEIDYRARVATWMVDEGGYQAIQSSRPQTLAFGLTDSPVGLASWILEKFHAWSDCDGDVFSVFPEEMLIDNLMVYWATKAIGPSIRYYYEASRLRRPLSAVDFVRTPTAIAMWPRDIALAPKELADRLYDVRSYRVLPRGGHFPAWEAPDLYATDLKTFAGVVISNKANADPAPSSKSDSHPKGLT